MIAGHGYQQEGLQSIKESFNIIKKCFLMTMCTNTWKPVKKAFVEASEEAFKCGICNETFGATDETKTSDIILLNYINIVNILCLSIFINF